MCAASTTSASMKVELSCRWNTWTERIFRHCCDESVGCRLAKANELAQQICAGLAAAHSRQIFHRDLKPSNILVDGRGHAHITDFGLATRTDEDTGEVVGTPSYMAPEQFRGDPATRRTDLYALGLVLYELYTGKRPFEGSTFAECRQQHLTTSRHRQVRRFATSKRELKARFYVAWKKIPRRGPLLLLLFRLRCRAETLCRP